MHFWKSLPVSEEGFMELSSLLGQGRTGHFSSEQLLAAKSSGGLFLAEASGWFRASAHLGCSSLGSLSSSHGCRTENDCAVQRITLNFRKKKKTTSFCRFFCRSWNHYDSLHTEGKRSSEQLTPFSDCHGLQVTVSLVSPAPSTGERPGDARIWRLEVREVLGRWHCRHQWGSSRVNRKLHIWE